MKPSSYGPFPFSPINKRPPIAWPNGARVAVWVIPNIEFFHLNDKIGGAPTVPNIPAWNQRDYGNRVGIYRMMEVFDRYSIRATVALNSDICIHHPEIMEEGMKRKWEWMGHGVTNSHFLTSKQGAAQRELIAQCLNTIQKTTGVRPKGWLGPGLQEDWESLELLAEEGIEYICDWCNDDQPYHMTLDSKKRMVAVQYAHEINDFPVIQVHHQSGAEFGDMIRRQFDVLYREGERSGRVMAIALHPFIMGVPHRIGALDAALEYVCKHDKVWLTTGTEITERFCAQVPGPTRN